MFRDGQKHIIINYCFLNFFEFVIDFLNIFYFKSSEIEKKNLILILHFIKLANINFESKQNKTKKS